MSIKLKDNISANISKNANTATTLATARTINGTSFNGSANITTANWGTARTLTIGNTGKSVNGSGNVSWTLSEIGAAAASHSHSYLPLSGGTVTGYTSMKEGFVVHAAAAGGGTSGYLKVATIKISGNYQNQSLFFKIGQRGRDVYDLELRYANTNHADPGIEFFKKDRENVYAYIQKSAAGVWDLYIHKSETYDRVDILDFKKGTHMSSVTVTWKDELVSGVPAGYIEATMKNIPSSRFAVPGAGNYWNNGVPLVGTNGVMEIGKYVDFHNTSETTRDYSTRLQSQGDTGNVVYLPTATGTLSRVEDWGLWRTNGGQDLICRDKRAMVGTTSDLVINYNGDFTGGTTIQSALNVTGNITTNQKWIKLGSRWLTIDSTAPSASVGDVWIQV